MKKLLKVLMPTIVGATALIPACASLSSCSKVNIKVLDTFEQETGDSVASYKFVMGHAPTDKKVTVKVVNKDGTKAIDKIQLYDSTESNSSDTITVDVDDNSTFTVPAGFVLAPSQSSTSEFGLEFSYKDGDKTITETIYHLKLKYNVDYSADLQKGDYKPQIKDVPDASYWDSPISTVGAIYLADILYNPAILQDDCLYSTSTNIAKAMASGSISGLTSFTAYFNDVVEEDDGVHIHMNYNVQGGPASAFSYNISASRKLQFKNFNFSFTLETPNGYTINALDVAGETAHRTMQIVDATSKYSLVGRFKGTFDYKDGDKDWVEGITYDDVITNSPDQSEIASNPASLLSFGIMSLTYDFEFGTETPEIKILSNYAKNSVGK